jgi:predicted dehydrogenase
MGLGSLGRWWIWVLGGLVAAATLTGVDADAGRADAAAEEYGIEVFADIGAALSRGADAVFVCTPPLSHSGIIRAALDAGCHVFTEISLVADGYAENAALAESRGLTFFLSSTLLYREEVTRIADAVADAGRPVNYIYHSGQLLSDWHPWESYKDFFAGDRRTSGCREIMAIEFPWLARTFGEIRGATAVCGSITDLDIDYPDWYMIRTEHGDGAHGAVCIDVASAKAARRLEVYGESLYLTWDGTPESLCVYDREEQAMRRLAPTGAPERLAAYNETVIEDAYGAEIRNFFDVIDGRAAPRHTPEKDAAVLRLIDCIESGAAFAAGEGPAA